MKDQRHCFSSDDIISTLPQDIIETILCLLQIQEAARTSILSRDWRYKWTKIPKLVFDQVSTGEKQPSLLEPRFPTSSSFRAFYLKSCRFFKAVYKVLLMHECPIYEFNISAFTSRSTCVDMDRIILHLSRTRGNTLKKLRLSASYKLCLYLFSFDKLTDLYLHKCYIELHDQQMNFNGFGSLTTLQLEYVKISKKTLLHLLANCPLLEIFTLVNSCCNISGDDDSTIIELFECLRSIENLTISLCTFENWFGLPNIRELPPLLSRLKYICIKDMLVPLQKREYGLPVIVLLIRNSPNLEKLYLQMVISPQCNDLDSYAMLDYSGIELKHLIEFEMEYFWNLKHELKFVKVILAKSPVLQKLRIFPRER